MKRYYIIEGDVTSAGGIVQRHTGSAQTTKVYDKVVSNIGDKINCPACGAVGTIAAVGHRQPFGNHSNIPAMENDICLCKCSPPPILKHSQELFFQNVDYSISSAMEAFNLSLPNLQQDLNNNLVDNKDQGNSYYKWWWGKLESNRPETIAQEKRSFIENFKAMHHQYAYGTSPITYEIDPKAWDVEVAFEDLPEMIQKSVDKKFDIGTALSKMNNGQTIDFVWEDLGLGGDYFRTIGSKEWPLGRLAFTAKGKLTKLGTDARGQPNFQFVGYLLIKGDKYSWKLDNTSQIKNAGIQVGGTLVELMTGKQTASNVYKKYEYEMPTTYARKFHFDYMKKGAKTPILSR